MPTIQKMYTKVLFVYVKRLISYLQGQLVLQLDESKHHVITVEIILALELLQSND